MANLSKILLDVRFLCNDIEAQALHELELYFALNKAKNVAMAMLAEQYPERLLTVSHLSSVADEDEYTPPAMYRLYRLEVPPTIDSTADPLIYSPISYEEHQGGHTGPVCWLFNEKLYIDPTLGYSDTDNIDVVYIPEVADAVAGATDWGIPAGFSDWIPLQAAMLVKQAHGDASWQHLKQTADDTFKAALMGARPAKRHTGVKYSELALRLE